MEFTQISESVYKMNIPFEDGYTSVFALENDGRWILLDFAATDEDGKRFIIPQVNKLNFVPEYLMCTHMHEDHCGAINILANVFPKAKIAAFSEKIAPKGKSAHCVKDGEIFFDRYKIISLAGHTDDSIGVLDLKNNILLCADALQQKGIAQYGANIDNTKEYVKTIEKVLKMDLSGIIASHEYEPFGSAVFGKKAVLECVALCSDVLNDIISVVSENINLSAQQITNIYNSKKEHLPIGVWTVRGVIDYLKTK